jgi:hypothetical protein
MFSRRFKILPPRVIPWWINSFNCRPQKLNFGWQRRAFHCHCDCDRERVVCVTRVWAFESSHTFSWGSELGRAKAV